MIFGDVFFSNIWNFFVCFFKDVVILYSILMSSGNVIVIVFIKDL